LPRTNRRKAAPGNRLAGRPEHSILAHLSAGDGSACGMRRPAALPGGGSGPRTGLPSSPGLLGKRTGRGGGPRGNWLRVQYARRGRPVRGPSPRKRGLAAYPGKTRLSLHPRRPLSSNRPPASLLFPDSAQLRRLRGRVSTDNAVLTVGLRRARPSAQPTVGLSRSPDPHYTSPVASLPDLPAALRRHWGYESFRPLQESIVLSLWEGHDTCVVMPTGGGKSLCYQLPAALQTEKTAVVVSPLIALMQDQVAQLEQIGIPAGLLNSSLPAPAQSDVIRRARQGRFRLLYLSPERLVRPETIAWLREIPIAYFVIDEAHCISQWGHEFRPEYRQLRALREQFPALPIAAFTASATQRVRHDIMEQLGLRDPRKFIASFHRANLRYLVKQCQPRTQPELLLRGLRSYPEGNVIVYAPTIKRVEETADFLEDHGIPAVPYHGQMDAPTRRRNQERWMADEVRVLVGTIAFGLGINKAAVRAVIHLALPQSLEHYYQEAGRAGRDGLPADCVLLWQKRDMGLLVYFIKQIEDRQEQNRAWDRYRDITGFAESS